MKVRKTAIEIVRDVGDPKEGPQVLWSFNVDSSSRAAEVLNILVRGEFTQNTQIVVTQFMGEPGESCSMSMEELAKQLQVPRDALDRVGEEEP